MTVAPGASLVVFRLVSLAVGIALSYTFVEVEGGWLPLVITFYDPLLLLAIAPAALLPRFRWHRARWAWTVDFAVCVGVGVLFRTRTSLEQQVWCWGGVVLAVGLAWAIVLNAGRASREE